jgi:predicted proteasome-type protease
MDSTLRSNLSVGMPLDLAVIGRDALRVTMARDASRPGDADFRDHERGLVERAPRQLRQGQDLTAHSV